MDGEILFLRIGPEVDASLERLARIYNYPRERLALLLLEEAVYAVEDTLDKSGQVWESIRFDFVHGGRRALRHEENEKAIEDLLNQAREMDI